MKMRRKALLWPLALLALLAFRRVRAPDNLPQQAFLPYKLFPEDHSSTNQDGLSGSHPRQRPAPAFPLSGIDISPVRRPQTFGTAPRAGPSTLFSPSAGLRSQPFGVDHHFDGHLQPLAWPEPVGRRLENSASSSFSFDQLVQEPGRFIPGVPLREPGTSSQLQYSGITSQNLPSWSGEKQPWDPRPLVHGVNVRWHIPQFTGSDGRQFGPYGLGRTFFEAKRYPLDFPPLLRFYNDPVWRTTDYEDFVVRNRFVTHFSVFRPEPQILADIQRVIHSALSSHGHQPDRVNPQVSLNELEWAWPPVAIFWDPTKLIVRKKMLKRTHQEIKNWPGSSPMDSLRRLTVRTDQGPRHILMTRVPITRNGVVQHIGTNSEFWLFHEGLVTHPHGKRPTMGLLGGMFLPKEAVADLDGSGLLAPALTHVRY